MPQYSHVDSSSNNTAKSGGIRRAVADCDVSSVASSISRKSSRFRMKRQNSDLSQPLTREGDGNDPYYVFRDDLLNHLDLMEESLAEYTRMVQEETKPAALKQAKKTLKRHLKNTQSTLSDVQTTVDVVAGDRTKFSHISEDQLRGRTAFVETCRHRLEQAQGELGAMPQPAEESPARRLNDVESQNSSAWTPADSQTQTHSRLLMQRQDETLDDLGEVVTRVGEMADNIHSELESQNKMLTEMEEDMEHAEEELGMVMGKLAKFLKTKNKWQLTSILGLSATALILFFLVLYT